MISKRNKHINIASIEDADRVINELQDRINTLEYHINALYKTHSRYSKTVSSSLNDFNTGISNVHRKISQNTKK